MPLSCRSLAKVGETGDIYYYYLRKIDLVYDWADSITLNSFNEVLYKLRYYSIDMFLCVEWSVIRHAPNTRMFSHLLRV